MSNIDKNMTKEIGNLLGKSVLITNFGSDHVIKVTIDNLDIVIVKDSHGEVTVTVDNYSSNTTLVTSLGKENDFRWY